MQAELEKWIAAHTIKIAAFDEPAFVIRPDDLRALLSRFVLCEKEPVAELFGTTLLSGRIVWDARPTAHGARLAQSRCKDPFPKPLYAPADVGTMRIVAIQGAAEEYARQGNTVLANELRDKFGKEGA
jgi:hypothetical protein